GWGHEREAGRNQGRGAVADVRRPTGVTETAARPGERAQGPAVRGGLLPGALAPPGGSEPPGRGGGRAVRGRRPPRGGIAVRGVGGPTGPPAGGRRGTRPRGQADRRTMVAGRGRRLRTAG